MRQHKSFLQAYVVEETAENFKSAEPRIHSLKPLEPSGNFSSRTLL